MIPAQADITIRRGDTFRFFFRLRKKNTDGTPGEYPVLTTWGSGLAQVRSAVDGTVVFTMTVTKANQTTYPGGVLLTIPAATTGGVAFPAGASPANGVWDFEIANDLGEIDTYLEGSVTYAKDVSHA